MENFAGKPMAHDDLLCVVLAGHPEDSVNLCTRRNDADWHHRLQDDRACGRDPKTGRGSEFAHAVSNLQYPLLPLGVPGARESGCMVGM